MSKKYFIMNNRENPHDGYKEVSEEFIKNYINSYPEGERAFFINLGYAIMETSETEYKKFYKEYRRKRYVDEEAERAGQISLNAIDSKEFDGTEVIVDSTEPLEERIQRQLMIEEILEAMSTLSDEEKEIIEKFYFDGMTEFDIAKLKGVSQQAISKRKKHILKKILCYFEK